MNFTIFWWEGFSLNEKCLQYGYLTKILRIVKVVSTVFEVVKVSSYVEVVTVVTVVTNQGLLFTSPSYAIFLVLLSARAKRFSVSCMQGS